MAIIQLEAGLAPSSSPAARLYLLSSIGSLTVCEKSRIVRYGIFLNIICLLLFLDLLRLKSFDLGLELGVLRLELIELCFLDRQVLLGLFDLFLYL